ncbi:TIGR03619 family F420-dependent LLM class oxidoreductase [Rhodococcus wratislaviensis]|uniref:Putative oxidoreductase n=1 Tax=Rhodococcus wratislaviensis NBRC 100605 TaxID=1219028 RepID=X0Q1E2_RHOWR|nr:TIGR03619 family F420-dependent LLM class oxidoreductase [Rhodococcus wratislaviensis]GAF44717.1 putative oxidoreductase [Rhodococcus wratislaviensis NBRC 100605]
MGSVGLSAYGMTAQDLVDLATCADELGFDALWLGEHVLHPRSYASEHPSTGTAQHHTGPIVDASTELIDPWLVHAAIAAVTSRIKLGTAVYVTALRHPLHTARSTITLQEMSGGRLLFGVGSGWLEEEFAAFGVPFRTRISRTEECLEIMRKAWSGTAFSHEGKHFRFDTVALHPQPVRVPVVLGGNGPQALARAARLGDAWFSSGTPGLDESCRLVDEIRGRRAELGKTDEFRCYVRIAEPSADELQRHRDRGLNDLVVWADTLWQGDTLDERRRCLTEAAHRLGVSESLTL